MIEAYIQLHNSGFAHSVETYNGNSLVGGLYGVSLGKAFFGESMFYKERDASKIALFHLNELMLSWDFHFIDVQQSTNHLRSFGAVDLPRKDFLVMLKKTLSFRTKQGHWDF
jgi:leucyl/phenylalanyl-tRNA--protein transferase